MNVFCPHCGSEFSVTWLTKETEGQRSIVRSNAAVTHVQTELNARLKGEGGLSGSDLGSGSDPDPSKLLSVPIKTGKRGRKDENEYPLAFLVIWERARRQGRAGNKHPAFKTWLRLNADDHLNALILSRFEEWTKADEWRRGYNPHLSTWLSAKGWQDPPTEADLRGPDATNARPGANGSVPGPSQGDYCDWHRKGNREKQSFRPRDTCPECRHVKAMNGTRASDPFEEDPMVTDIKRRRGLL